MSLPPSLKSAMTPFPYSLAPEAPLEEAARLMEEHGVHHLPVMVDHKVVGILTPGDMAEGRLKAGDQAKPTVGDCYVPEVYLVDLEEPLDRVLLTMAENHIGSVVVTRHGRLAGVFTALDACRSFGAYLAENFPHGDDGAAA